MLLTNKSDERFENRHVEISENRAYPTTISLHPHLTTSLDSQISLSLFFQYTQPVIEKD